MAEGSDPVVLFPADVLRTPCLPIGRVGEAERRLGRKLASSMAEAGGIGLAAPQIGVSLRAVAVGSRAQDGSFVPVVMFDPQVLWASDRLTPMAEGCLSLPGRRFMVARPNAVKVAFTDMLGRRMVAEMSGLPAKCVQHEIDHLDGVLIIDRGREVLPPDDGRHPEGGGLPWPRIPPWR